MNPSLALGILAFGLAGAGLLHALRRGDRDPLFFPVAAGYALAVEAVQRLFLHYDYVSLRPEFRGVPLLVPLAWAGVWYVGRTLGLRLAERRPWPVAAVIGGLAGVLVAVPLEALAAAGGWWHWSEQPALAPLQAFTAGFTFLLGYELVTRMGLTGQVRTRVRLLFLILTLAPLLFIHAQALYLARELLL